MSKTTDEMLADIQAILEEDDDEEETLPDEDAPVRGVSTQHRRPDEDPQDTPLSGAMEYIRNTMNLIAVMHGIIEVGEYFEINRDLNRTYEDAVGGWRERMEQRRRERVESAIIHIPQPGELLELMHEYPDVPVTHSEDDFEEPPNPSNIQQYMDAMTSYVPILMRPVSAEEQELMMRIHETFEGED